MFMILALLSPTEVAVVAFTRKAEELRQPALVLQSVWRADNSRASFLLLILKGPMGRKNEAKKEDGVR